MTKTNVHAFYDSNDRGTHGLKEGHVTMGTNRFSELLHCIAISYRSISVQTAKHIFLDLSVLGAFLEKKKEWKREGTPFCNKRLSGNSA